ncbi:MAG: lipoate--protein ligase family protein [Candidatus Omnitrophica bacterium]|nr:lipoate--protein ligase family protein [Candidatus Omnitrophota bacterium]
MNSWLLYPSISAPMPFQMAFDEILFRQRETETGPPILRFYFSSEPWISVGFSYRDTPSSPTVRRITGGGLVRHGSDLIFSLIARKSDDESFKSVRVSYWKIHEAVKAGLEAIGNLPRFYRCDENLPRGQDCFRYPIATDLAVGPDKAAGGAQKRSAGALLHQESIQWKGMPDSETLIPALKEGFEKIFKVALVWADLDPALLEEAEKLSEEKYKFNNCHSEGEARRISRDPSVLRTSG